MNPIQPIRTLIADDHPLITDGLVKLLQNEPDIEVVFVASNGKQAWENYQLQTPELSILDIDMGELDGIQLTERIKAFNTNSKVVLLTMHTVPWILARAKKAKPNGILLKSMSPNEIVCSIKRIINGERVFSHEINQILNSCNVDYDSIQSLTSRELEVLKLISKGLTTSQISENLFLSVNTIETYRKNLLLKFDTPNVASMIKRASEMGIL